MEFYSHRNFNNFKTSIKILFQKEACFRLFSFRTEALICASFPKVKLSEVLKFLKFFRDRNFIEDLGKISLVRNGA